MELRGSLAKDLKGGGATPKKPARFSRRRFLQLLGGTAFVGGGVYSYGALFEAHRLVVEHVAVTVPGLATRWHGKRVVQLTDFHAGKTSIGLIESSLAM